jgi:hypothetical protein
MIRRMRTALALVFLAACNASSSEAGPAPEPTAVPSASSTAPQPPKDGGAKDAGPHGASEALQQCAKSKGELGSIADAVARLNTLGSSADGPCFVATLPRPLAVVATSGKSSAQPAFGTSAPRILLMLPKLVITVVPAGEGSKLLEFGEWIGTTRTIKGEIGFPITVPLAADAPFLRVSHGTDKTTCGTCHRQEEPHPTIANAFLSLAFKPEPGTFVTLDDLAELHRLCTNADDPGSRCAMLHALFDFGELTEGSFSPAVATFQGP